MRKITLNQIHSIGDIIFIEPIIRQLETNGYEVIIPIRDHLMWLSNHIKSGIFVPLSKSQMDINDSVLTKDYIPLRFANQLIRGLVLDDHSNIENAMLDKYVLFNQWCCLVNKEELRLNPVSWKDIRLTFDNQKSNKLLSIVEKKPYILVNNYSQAGKIDIKPETNYNIVYMEDMQEYSLCDWKQVLLDAIEIHTVSTSILFLLQSMDFVNRNVPTTYVYPRPNWDGLKGIQNLHFTYNVKRIENEN